MGDLTKYFSATYQESRQKLSDAASKKQIRVQKHALESGDNAPSTDVYWFGAKDASKKLILSSGLHGAELFAGAAIQLKAVEDGKFDNLPDDTAVIVIHALNPIGSIKLRRVNENNVDLNRNFVDWNTPHPPEHFLTQRVQEKLKPKRWCWPLTLSQSFYYIARYGMKEMQTSLQQGQYTIPDGLFYGGNKDEVSNTVFRRIIEECRQNTSHLVHLDVHTGLGKRGDFEMIMSAPETTKSFQRAQSWWGHDKVRSVNSGDSVSAVVSGSIHDAFNTAAFEGCQTTLACLEFGTIPPIKVLKALAYDNWVHNGNDTPETIEKAQNMMRDAFSPQDAKWQESVLSKGLAQVDKALLGLSKSSKMTPS